MAPHQLQAYLFLTNGVLKFTAGDWWFAIFFRIAADHQSFGCSAGERLTKKSVNGKLEFCD